MESVTIKGENVYAVISGERHHIGTLKRLAPKKYTRYGFAPMGVVGNMIFDRPIIVHDKQSIEAKLKNYTLYNLDGTFRVQGERQPIQIPEIEDF